MVQHNVEMVPEGDRGYHRVICHTNGCTWEATPAPLPEAQDSADYHRDNADRPPEPSDET